MLCLLFCHETRALTLRHARRKMGRDAFVREGLHDWEAWQIESIGFFYPREDGRAGGAEWQL